MADWYCEIVDARGRGSKTGKGAAWSTEAEARAGFEVARRLSVEGGGFLVDLHDGDGNLLDTVHVDEAGFEALIGEAPKSVAEYEEFDRAWWKARREERVADA